MNDVSENSAEPTTNPGSGSNKPSNLLNRFRFNRTDALLIIALIVVACCTYSSFLEANSLYNVHSSNFLAPLFWAGIALAGAMGAIIARKRLDFVTALALIAILGMGYLVHSNAAEIVSPGINKFKEYQSTVQQSFPEPPWLFAVWYRAPAAFVMSLLTSILVTALLFQIPKRLGFARRGLKWISTNRLKCLIGVAILLASLNTIGNIFFAKGSNVLQFLTEGLRPFVSTDTRILGFEPSDILGIGLMAIALVALLIGVTAIATSHWRYWVRFTTLGLFFAAAVGICLIQISTNQMLQIYSDFYLPSTVIASAIYFLGLPALSKPRALQPAMARIPSAWACLFLLPALATASVFGYLYDPLWLMQPNNLIRGFDEKVSRFELASLSRKYSHDSNGCISLRMGTNLDAVWGVTIGDNADQDVLALIPNALLEKTGRDDFQQVVIEGIQPFVDTSILIDPNPLNSKRPPVGLTLTDGLLTSKQAGELSAACSWLSLSNVELPTVRDPKFVLSNPLALDGNSELSIAKFLDSHIIEPGPPIFVQKRIDKEEWAAIVRASKHSPITLHFLPAQNIVLESANKPLGNILVYPMANTEKSIVEFQELALNTDINLPYVPWTEQQRWDLAFISKSQLSTANFESFLKLSDIEFLKKAKKFNWIVQESRGLNSPNPPNIPVEIWLSETTYIKEHFSVFNQLKTLRLDVRGITNMLGVGSVICNYDDLDGLEALEELHLPTGVQLDELDFFKTSPMLRLLQIQNQDRSQQKLTGFEQCMNLEVLIMFDGPDAKSIAELQQLEKLKTITIVDDAKAFTTSELKASFQNQFPNAKVKFVAGDDYVPATSDAFKKRNRKLKAKIEEQIKADASVNSK